MSPTPGRPVLTTLIRVACEATGAARGRVIRSAPSTGLPDVVAVEGGDERWALVPDSGIASYVIATGQPQVLTRSAASAGASSALCVPCICDDEVVGALEFEDKAGGGPFSVDDLELAGLLGGIAGVALAQSEPAPMPDPARLASDLSRLAAADGARYATIARLVRRLLDA